MNNPGKFQRSWMLFRSAVSVIRGQPKLLAFPILSGACVLFITLFFLGGIALQPTGHSYSSGEHWQSIARSLFSSSAAVQVAPGSTETTNSVHFTSAGGLILAGLYLVSMFLATFFNVAFFHEILAALRGDAVSLRRGFQFGVSRLPAILLWTFFAGLIGLVIKEISERLGWIGSLIARFIGLAWSVATVFAIPVLVTDEQTSNPIEVLKKSALTLKQAWGETLIGYAGLQFASVLVAFATFLVVAGAVAVMALMQIFILPILAIAFWLLALFAYSYLMNVAGQVYKGALYIYATERVVVEPFNQDMLDRAWKHRK